MHKEKISLQHKYGIIEGIYVNAGAATSLVIIINGHNGFYNYGMFPYLQETLYLQNISSYSFNFSHGGIKGDSDYFEYLVSYQKNCMMLEVEDVMCVLHNLHERFNIHPKVFFLAHSLGGVPAIFSATKAQDENIIISGIILISTVSQLNFWPEEMLDDWKQNKIYYKKNNRTQQLLPQGEEFLKEVLQSDSTWNVKKEIKKLQQPILILHGENDEAVPPEHGKSLYSWIQSTNKSAVFKIVPEATHTYNTKHPFEGTNPQLEEMLNTVITFIEFV